jgi:hypothetical protein
MGLVWERPIEFTPTLQSAEDEEATLVLLARTADEPRGAPLVFGEDTLTTTKSAYCPSLLMPSE